jgi:twitching motility protein PilT
VRLQLSNTLEGIIYQVLLPRSRGQGRVAAVEVLLATSAVRNLIREGKTHQLPNAIQTGGQYGMQSLNQSLRALCQGGMISPEEALARSTDFEELKQMLGGH